MCANFTILCITDQDYCLLHLPHLFNQILLVQKYFPLSFLCHPTFDSLQCRWLFGKVSFTQHSRHCRLLYLALTTWNVSNLPCTSSLRCFAVIINIPESFREPQLGLIQFDQIFWPFLIIFRFAFSTIVALPVIVVYYSIMEVRVPSEWSDFRYSQLMMLK